MHRLKLLLVGLAACGPPSESGDKAVSTVDSAVALPPCPEDGAFRLAWPLDGEDALDWVTVNYFDLDPGPGLEDYTGQTGEDARTYDGHNGVDIGISSFRAMDRGMPVWAAAPGEVVYVVDGFEDRNTACENTDANVVSVLHASGHEVQYVHLRKGSTRVRVGDPVEVGDLLGEVGSSGCSTGPHLHLGVLAPDRSLLDPFRDGLWCAPPVYDTPIGWMEGWLLAGPVEQYAEPTKDPPLDVERLAVGDTLLAYGVVAGGAPGNTVAARFDAPDGTVIGPWRVVLEKSNRLGIWSWTLTVPEPTGQWTVTWLLNGVQVDTATVIVE